MLEAALAYAAKGWKVFPLKARSKQPATVDGYKAGTCDDDQIRRWWGTDSGPHFGIGLALAPSGLLAVDVDPRAGGVEVLDNCEFLHGALPRTCVQITGRGDGGHHILLRAGKGIRYPGKIGPGVDIKHNGFIVLAPSLHPDTGAAYFWSDAYSDPPPAPEWLAGARPGAGEPEDTGPEDTVRAGVTAEQWGEICDALHSIDPDTGYSDWVMIGQALKATGQPNAFVIWDSWSRKGSKYKEGDCDVRWKGFAATSAGGVDYRVIFERAGRAGWRSAIKHHFQPYDEEVPLDSQAAAAAPGSGAAAEPATKSDATDLPDADDTSDLTGPEPKVERLAIGQYRWSDFVGRVVPEREWVVEEWVGLGHVTSLYGKGGIGKSLIAQQMATCVVTGTAFLGLPVRRGRVLGLFCEDDWDELRRRAGRINRVVGCGLRDLDPFVALPRVGEDNVLLAAEGRSGGAIVHGTRTFARLEQELRAARAEGDPYVLVIIDNLGIAAAINENDRSLVTQVVAKLAGLAHTYSCALLALGHPSKAGESEYSGSTAWNAAVRSRLLLSRPKDKDGKEIQANPDDRVLSLVKGNYSAAKEIPLVYRDGCYVRTDQGDEASARQQAQNMRQRDALDEVMAVLRTLLGRGEKPSDERSSTKRYLPKLAVAHNLIGDFGERELAQALDLAVSAKLVERRTGQEPGQRREMSWIEPAKAPWEPQE